MNDELRISELLEQAGGLEDGPSKVMLHEEAVRLADTLGDAHLGYDLRRRLIQSATFGGYPDKALVAFTWCLAYCDRERERHLEYDMLWKFKWIAGNLANFPQIPRRQIEDVFEDMTRRYRKAGVGLHAVHKLRCDAAMDMGERAAAVKMQKAWRRSARDFTSDCAACECDHEVRYQIFLGKDKDAIEQAEPILDGRLRCASVPHRTLARLLLPLVRLGRLDEAMRSHQEGIRLVAANRARLGDLANHLTFLVLTDNLAAAVKLLERHLAWALETADAVNRFDFYLAAWFLLRRLAEGKKPTLRLRLPPFPAHQDTGTYKVAQLAKWFEDQVRTLAATFDKRNGSDHFSGRVAESEQLNELVTPYPVPSRRRETPERGSNP